MVANKNRVIRRRRSNGVFFAAEVNHAVPNEFSDSESVLCTEEQSHGIFGARKELNLSSLVNISEEGRNFVDNCSRESDSSGTSDSDVVF